jgi:hypothetical protein
VLNLQEKYDQETKGKLCRVGLVAGMIGTSIGRSQADVIKMESFEMKSDAETYTDPMDPAIDHFLVNQPGQALVVHAGWSAWYRNTRNGVGLTDGDIFGVGQSGPGTWADGQQGYRLNDTDGAIDLHFDPVDGANTVHLSVFITDSVWEEDDLIQISWGTHTILDTLEMDIDDLNIEGRWLELTTTSRRFEALRITVDTNANDEGVFIDHIRWSQTVPSPGGLALLGLSLARPRRRR